MKYAYFLSLFFLSIMLGCHMPPRIEISSTRVLKTDIASIKTVITGQSFAPYDEVEDVPHCVDYGSFEDCYFLTRYIKPLEQIEPQAQIFIMLITRSTIRPVIT